MIRMEELEQSREEVDKTEYVHRCLRIVTDVQGKHWMLFSVLELCRNEKKSIIDASL